MKKLLLVIMCMIAMSGFAEADSVIVNLGAKSDHLIEGKFNEEDHNWLGLGYRFIEEDKYSVQIEGVSFINSYYDDTKFIALTAIYTPVRWRDIKLGVSGSVGYQEGYYATAQGAIHPDAAKRLGINDTSILVLYTVYAELDNLVVNYTYIPYSVQAVTFGFKVIEWGDK